MEKWTRTGGGIKNESREQDDGRQCRSRMRMIMILKNLMSIFDVTRCNVYKSDVFALTLK